MDDVDLRWLADHPPDQVVILMGNHAPRADAELYEWLALVDAVRAGRARQRELSVKKLRSSLS